MEVEGRKRAMTSRQVISALERIMKRRNVSIGVMNGIRYNNFLPTLLYPS